ncbi:MAG: antirestriction protein ArdA, partial [Pseudomonadota bacterium]
MKTVLYAQPYDLSAVGFFFESAEEYRTKAPGLRNAHGQSVEEFEIQFIDGEAIDAALAVALGIYIPQLAAFFEAVETWDEDQKLRAIIAVGECGYAFDWATADPDGFDVDIYEGLPLRDLAEQFVEEGLFGEIPERLAFYLDYDAIARDL